MSLDFMIDKEPLFDSTGAACAEADPDMFFPEGIAYLARTRVAKSYCAVCPIVEACLDYAIKNDEWGIWGGTTRAERKSMSHGRSKARKTYIATLQMTHGSKNLFPLKDENTIIGLE